MPRQWHSLERILRLVLVGLLIAIASVESLGVVLVELQAILKLWLLDWLTRVVSYVLWLVKSRLLIK
jgi:hypothetical protein